MRLRTLEGNRLRAERESRGLSQHELGRLIGAGLNQVNRYENGQADPSLYQLKRLAKELQVSADYLLGLVDSKTAYLKEPDLTALERRFLGALRQGQFRLLLRMLDQALPDEQDEAQIAARDVGAEG